MEPVRILAEIEESLEMLSSREFQERVWLKGEGPEVSSYEELISHLFGDLGFSELVRSDWSGFSLTTEQKATLARFDTHVSAFNAIMPELSSPEFAVSMLDQSDVRRVATDALRALRAARQDERATSSTIIDAD